MAVKASLSEHALPLIERHEIGAASFIHSVGNCLTVNLVEFATAIWISKTDRDLHGSNLRHRAKRNFSMSMTGLSG
jgi:hypothetical protein